MIEELRSFHENFGRAASRQIELASILPGTLEQDTHLFFLMQIQIDIGLACNQLGVDIRRIGTLSDDELNALIDARMAQRTLSGYDASNTRAAYEEFVSAQCVPVVAHCLRMLEEPVQEIGIPTLIASLRRLISDDDGAQCLMERCERQNHPNGFVMLSRQLVRDIADGATGILGFSFEPGLEALLGDSNPANELEPMIEAAATGLAEKTGRDAQTMAAALTIYLNELCTVATSVADRIPPRMRLPEDWAIVATRARPGNPIKDCGGSWQSMRHG